MIFFLLAYEFLSADYKIWNTNGDALFAFPPPEVNSQWLKHNLLFCKMYLRTSHLIYRKNIYITGTNLLK